MLYSVIVYFIFCHLHNGDLYLCSFTFSDSSDSMNEFLWKDKINKPRKGATGEDLSDIYKDYSLPSGKCCGVCLAVRSEKLSTLAYMLSV